MDPELARFESEQPNVSYVHINIDEKDKLDENDHPTNKETFEKYFKGKSIPYTVLLNKEGEKVTDWTGYVGYGKLVDDIKSARAE